MRRRHLDSAVRFPSLLRIAHILDDRRFHGLADMVWQHRNGLMERAIRQNNRRLQAEQSDERACEQHGLADVDPRGVCLVCEQSDDTKGAP